MKNSIKVLFSITVILTLALFITNSFAGEMLDYSADRTVLNFSEYTNEENILPYLRITTSRAEVDTDVNKSGMCIAEGNINVNGNMNKSHVLISADTVRISKSIENAMIFSQTVIIDGEINGTVVICTNKLSISDNAVINGEILTTASSVECSGTVIGNVIGVCQTLNVLDNANISGGLRFQLAEASISDSCNLTGKLYLKSQNDIKIPDTLKDYSEFVKLDKVEYKESKVPVFKIVVSSLIFGLIGMFIVSSKKVQSIREKVKKNLSIAIISGALSIIVVPILIFISVLLSLAVPSVGVPVTVALIALMILAITLRIFIGALAISVATMNSKYSKVFDSKLRVFTLITIISIVLYLLEYIPFVNTVITMLYIIITAGITYTALLYKSAKK